MSKKFSFSKYMRLLSGASSSRGYKMVRYFQNPYQDAKEASAELDKREVKCHIDNYLRGILGRLTPNRKHVDGGLYVGVTGVAFMFYTLYKNPVLADEKNMYMQKGLEYLNPALECSAGDKTSFLLGDAGTYAVGCAMFHEISDDRYKNLLSSYRDLYPLYLQSKFLKYGGDELFVGRAGYLAGALWLSKEIKTDVLEKDKLYKICDIIVANGREYAKKRKSPCPLMYHYYNTEYLGAAHGISFILQILMTVPGYLEFNKSAADDIKASTLFIASLQTDEGNFPCCMEELGQPEHKLVHWCHGAPGTIYLMMKAYLVFKDPKFYNVCIKAGELVWGKGLLRKGPGICHGVAGNAYAFLLLYRLTRNDLYLHRAKKFAEFLNCDEFIRDARTPDNPESLYEGTAGTVCFLSDLLDVDKAEFPFQDVFSVYE